MFSTIIFDMDGVLVTAKCRESALKDACRQIASKNERKLKEVWDFILKKWKLEKDHLKKYNWDFYIEKAQSEFNTDLKIDYESLIKANLEKAETYPDVVPTLYNLQGSYKLILVTNGFSKYQCPILKSLNLYKFFNKIFTSDSGFVKPDPKILGKDCPTGSEVLFVDDRLYQGIYLGKQIEATTFLLDRHYRRRLHKRLDKRYLGTKLNQELKEDKINISLEKVLPNYISNTLQDILKII